MVEIKHVTKIYGGTYKAMNNISLTISAGEIIGFIDPDDAGKTITIKMTMGVLNPDEGETLISGENIVKELLETKKEFGIVPDSADISPRLKGLEYLNFMGDIYEVDSEQRKQRITSLVEVFEMEDTLSDRTLSYSHDTRQKIVIMGVLLFDSSVWVLNEPMIGPDLQSSYSLKEMMKGRARRGDTTFLSTHVLEVAGRLCGRVAIINRGRIVFFGTLEELKQLHPQCDSLEAPFIEVIAHV